MPGPRLRRIAVVGGGPAGASLAAYLARRGIRVALFARRERPPLVVGESLVPAVIPFLRELGVEAEVAAASVYKPGATFLLGPEDRLSFRFCEVRGARTPYAYNVPRDHFDACVLEAARRAGAAVLERRAGLERDSGERVRLDADSRGEVEAALGGPPDWIVDASGRARLLARLLGLPEVRGERRDTALHAHLEGVPLLVEGDVHTDRLAHGWSWRIPLPHAVSVGLVMDGRWLREIGDTLEAQFDGYLAHDPVTREWSTAAKRVSPVVRYTNYQLRTLRGVGDGWALVGDSFGFIDPVFSSGLLVAMDGAHALAAALADGSPRALRRYERRVLRHLVAWHRVVGHFYSGRLFMLHRVGSFVETTRLGRAMAPHMVRHIPRVLTGETTMRRYSLGLFDFMNRYALAGNDPAELAIR